MPDISPAILPKILGAGQRDVLASPFQFYLTGSENLQITVFNSLPGVVVVVQGRIFDTEGAVKPVQYTITPTSDRMASTLRVPMGRCLVSNLVAFASSGSPRIGQTFVQLKIIQGFAGATIVLGTLIQGYVTGAQERAWPGSTIENSLDGGGYTRSVTGTAPAAGAEINETTPTGARWELLTFVTTLTAAAAGLARRTRLQFTTGGGVGALSPQPGTTAPGTALSQYWSQGMPMDTQFDPTVTTAGLALGSVLLAGDRITTSTVNLNAADQYLAPIFVVREWIEAQ